MFFTQSLPILLILSLKKTFEAGNKKSCSGPWRTVEDVVEMVVCGEVDELVGSVELLAPGQGSHLVIELVSASLRRAAETYEETKVTKPRMRLQEAMTSLSVRQCSIQNNRR